MRQTLEMALEFIERVNKDGWILADFEPEMYKTITAIKEALAQPEEEKLHPVHIGVDVTKEGTAVTAFYRRPNSVMEMFYSQFHPLAQPEQEPVCDKDPQGCWSVRCQLGNKCKNTPPQRKPLTDEQIEQMWERTGDYDSFARAIEAAHGIKE